MHGDVVDGDLPDAPLERAGVRMAVEHHVGAVLGDRRRESIGAEHHVNALRLALDRRLDRRIVQQDDAKVAVDDLLQPARDRLGLVRRLGVHPAQQRFTEIGEHGTWEAADEALRADDTELEVADVARAPRAVEHVHAGLRDHSRDLLWMPRVKVVVAEHREHGHAYVAARVGDNLRLLRIAGRREISREQDDVAFLLKPEDAEAARAAFEAAGWLTEKPPEGWLYKVWHENGALVDLIFNPASGPITEELIERSPEAEVMALRVHVSTLEDVMVAKLLALTEQEPDFSAALVWARALRQQIDWADVRSRTEASPFAKACFTL